MSRPLSPAFLPRARTRPEPPDAATRGRQPAAGESPERTIFATLEECSLTFARHADDLPGRPDVVFGDVKLAVFIDGNFWHGWRFPLWQHKLSDKWRNKIAATRRRDRRNFRKLRRLGWKVLRLWEHQIENRPERCIERIIAAHAECVARWAATNGDGATG